MPAIIYNQRMYKYMSADVKINIYSVPSLHSQHSLLIV